MDASLSKKQHVVPEPEMVYPTRRTSSLSLNIYLLVFVPIRFFSGYFGPSFWSCSHSGFIVSGCFISVIDSPKTVLFLCCCWNWPMNIVSWPFTFCVSCFVSYESTYLILCFSLCYQIALYRLLIYLHTLPMLCLRLHHLTFLNDRLVWHHYRVGVIVTEGAIKFPSGKSSKSWYASTCNQMLMSFGDRGRFRSPRPMSFRL